MRRPLKLLFAIVATLVIALLAAAVLLRPQRPPPVQVPTPNGYDDFLKAAGLVTEVPSDLSIVSDANLQKFVEDNAETLRLIRSGLSKESKIPLQYNQASLQSHFAEIGKFKRLGLMLVAIGHWHERRGQTNEAAQVYAETARYAHESFRGGLLIDLLISVAIETIGTRPLRKVTPTLDALACREIMARLLEVDAAAEPFDEIMTRERNFFEANLGVRYHWSRLVFAIRTGRFDPMKPMVDNARQKYETQRRYRYEVMAEIAARAYELEHGRPPKRFDDLSPAYIKSIPAEFRSGPNVIYRFY